ncbi:hypothetical protein [Brevundimonas sp.]|uniref:hypothetical protein n=1 Tax=Brevundimonas sp. TaxID=1871086 RepID=UPI0028981F9E|nr:hypothetical protein [Brevundimonas sp.]
MWTLAGIGAFIGGLFLMLRELLPLLKARQTGVIRSKGHAGRRIERAVDPERFEGLCRARLKAAGAGGLLAVGGLVWTIMQVVGIAMASAG